ncbi:LuxR family transcriptional regulator [Pseudonocardiaceae bacterium YIM PH 21723]|nr:LuxR family transcriptional regulator [Pseudonocardiaceae bacterium YIM PH 21723]
MRPAAATTSAGPDDPDAGARPPGHRHLPAAPGRPGRRRAPRAAVHPALPGEPGPDHSGVQPEPARPVAVPAGQDGRGGDPPARRAAVAPGAARPADHGHGGRGAGRRRLRRRRTQTGRRPARRLALPVGRAGRHRAARRPGRGWPSTGGGPHQGGARRDQLRPRGRGGQAAVAVRGHRLLPARRQPPVRDQPGRRRLIVSSPGNLPVELTSFVGRDVDLGRITTDLRGGRMLTLTGTPGVGKTRLALRGAAAVAAEFPDGNWFVELAAVGSGDLVAHTVAQVLGIRDNEGLPPLRLLADHLRDRRALIVLDNCEHLTTDCATLIDTLLTEATGLAVLATSREALGAAGERVYEVDPLEIPAASTGPATDWAPALRLFAQRAVAVCPSFTITDANLPTIIRICQKVDGIPLAIELAAARLSVLSVDEVLHRLTDRFRLLTSTGRGLPARHRTLRETVNWSYQLCSPDEQQLWAHCSVFAGGFTADAAAAVSGLPVEQTRELLGRLADKSVLIREPGNMLRMLDTIRHFGRDHLADPVAVSRRHAQWYLELAKQANQGWFGPEQARWISRLHREHANLRAVLAFCLDNPDETRTGLRIAAMLSSHWFYEGLVAEGQQWIQRLLAKDNRPSRQRVALLTILVMTASVRGEAYVGTLADQLMEQAQAVGDGFSQVQALTAACTAATVGEDFDRAVALGKRAIQQAGAPDTAAAAAAGLQVGFPLSMALLRRGDIDEAVALSTRLVDGCRRAGDQTIQLWGLAGLGLAALYRRQADVAAGHACDMLRLRPAQPDLKGIALAVEILALAAADEGNTLRAAELFGGAEQLWSDAHASGLRGATTAPLAVAVRASLRETMGQAYAQAITEGRALTLSEVIDYALRPVWSVPSTWH